MKYILLFMLMFPTFSFAKYVTYDGYYYCRQGKTQLKLKINTPGMDKAIFEFTTATNTSGSFNMTGLFNERDQSIRLNGNTWISKPEHYSTVDLSGVFNENLTTLKGEILTDGCSSFEVSINDKAQNENDKAQKEEDIHWITDSVSGCKVWNQNPSPNESINYTGTCKDGIASGKGSVQWYKNGELTQISEGNYIDGRLHGKGKLTWKGGLASGDDWYIGDFFKGRITGFGEKTFRCNCGAWSCHQCIDRGVFQDGKLVGSAPDGVNNVSEYKAWQKMENKRQAKETQEYESRVSHFRKSLAIGDESSLGIVIEIRGKIVKIQTTESQCTQRDSTNNCLNWIDSHLEKWVPLSEVYPK